MQFPDTWEEFEQAYGFEDKKEIYTNGSRLIQSFRVKQWLDRIADPEERTAKVEHHGTISYPFHHCGECGREVKEYDEYCSGCGARLEWE